MSKESYQVIEDGSVCFTLPKWAAYAALAYIAIQGLALVSMAYSLESKERMISSMTSTSVAPVVSSAVEGDIVDFIHNGKESVKLYHDGAWYYTLKESCQPNGEGSHWKWFSDKGKAVPDHSLFLSAVDLGELESAARSRRAADGIVDSGNGK